jgi:hypothetical protein
MLSTYTKVQMIFTVDKPWYVLDGENQSKAYLEKPLCSKTLLTGEPGSIVSVGASLGREPLRPWAGSKWLTN